MGGRWHLLQAGKRRKRMTILENTQLERRKVLGGMLAGGSVLLLPACATTGGFNLVEAIRQLLMLSSTRAFARLSAQGGYWDQGVSRLGLEGFLGNRGGVLAQILTSSLFRGRMENAFASVAERASDRAAPVVADAVRVIGVENAIALVRGEPTAATAFLRGSMGDALIQTMVPEVGQAMRIAQEPLVAQLLSRLSGVDVAGLSNSFSGKVNDVIWHEIGVEEAAIRANPRSTNDPLLIAVLTGASVL
jgi:hypothetical protein